MLDVFNINDLIYSANVNTEPGKGGQQTATYKDILDRIRHIISKNHSAELIGILYSDEARERLKNLIVRYLNQNKLYARDCSNISELADRIYEDMAGFGVLTKYISDTSAEEININSWDAIEVIYPDKTVMLDERFLSPEDCMDKIKKMVWLGGSIIDGANPKVDSFIGVGSEYRRLFRRAWISEQAESRR